MEDETTHIQPVVFDQKTLERALVQHGSTAIQELGRRAFGLMIGTNNDIPKEFKVLTVGLDKQQVNSRFLNIPQIVLSKCSVLGESDNHKVAVLETTYKISSEPVTFYFAGWIEEKSLVRHSYSRNIDGRDVKSIERGFLSSLNINQFNQTPTPTSQNEEDEDYEIGNVVRDGIDLLVKPIVNGKEEDTEYVCTKMLKWRMNLVMHISEQTNALSKKWVNDILSETNDATIYTKSFWLMALFSLIHISDSKHRSLVVEAEKRFFEKYI